MNTYVYGFGKIEIKNWKDLIHRKIRYCGSEDNYDVYEIEDETADDYGELYATHIE